MARDAADILGQSVKDIHPRTFSTLSHYIEKVLSGAPVSFEDSITYPDRVTRDIQVLYTPRHTDSGGVDGYFALVEDITERKITEAQLQQAQKMESVGQLTGGIAHDFNNLLGVIMGNLELLTERDGEGREAMLESALRAAQRGAELTHRLLAFSRKQTLRPEIVDLNNLVTNMADFVKRTLGETITFQAILAPVFEPFFTTKGVGEGSGLGLSMVHGFIKQSNGHISIHSREGAGTLVKLYFPAHRPDARLTPPPTATPIAARNSTAETILVVEDDPGLRQLAMLILTQLGYKTLDAPDGSAAVAILEGDAAIDLLFTDVILPGGISGPEIAAKALDLRPGLQILFTSGYAENALDQNEGTLETIEVIPKPYHQNDLAQRIRAMLDKKSR